MAKSSKRSGRKSRIKTSRILESPIDTAFTLPKTGLQINDNASKRFHRPPIMVTASRTPKSLFHSAFRHSESSPTKYGYHQSRTTTSNNCPTSRTSRRISLWSSTYTAWKKKDTDICSTLVYGMILFLNSGMIRPSPSTIL